MSEKAGKLNEYKNSCFSGFLSFISRLSSKPFEGIHFQTFSNQQQQKTSPPLPPQLGTFQLGRIISFDKLLSELCWETFFDLYIDIYHT